MKFTEKMSVRLRDYLSCHHLPVGRGTRESACSITAINLAVNGRLTDEIPKCMSEVVGSWIRSAQDVMPSVVRNSEGWKSLLPLAAGTGRDPVKERERLGLILEWMWGALALMQPVADKGGYGVAWARMVEERTTAAADAAADAAAAFADAAAGGICARRAAAAATTADAGQATALVGSIAAYDPSLDFWAKADPVALLAKLVRV